MNYQFVNVNIVKDSLFVDRRLVCEQQAICSYHFQSDETQNKDRIENLIEHLANDRIHNCAVYFRLKSEENDTKTATNKAVNKANLRVVGSTRTINHVKSTFQQLHPKYQFFEVLNDTHIHRHKCQAAFETGSHNNAQI